MAKRGGGKRREDHDQDDEVVEAAGGDVLLFNRTDAEMEGPAGILVPAATMKKIGTLGEGEAAWQKALELVGAGEADEVAVSALIALSANLTQITLLMPPPDGEDARQSGGGASKAQAKAKAPKAKAAAKGQAPKGKAPAKGKGKPGPKPKKR